jgi:RNA polymerase sigma-70 factor (ECF subfamily)
MHFDELFGAHHEFVWRFARSLVGDPAAEDVAQEVFVIAQRRLASLEGGSTRAWLASITRNVARNTTRGQRRRDRHLAALPDPPPDLTPDQWLQMQHAADQLDAFVSSLGAKHREAFVLLDVEGLTGAEAAAALRVPVRTVYSRVRAARERFAAWLEAQR